jgi:hypothetical protein
MSECNSDMVASMIAELAYSAIKAGMPILDIPKYVETAIQRDVRFSDPEMKSTLKVIFSNNNIETRSLM